MLIGGVNILLRAYVWGLASNGHYLEIWLAGPLALPFYLVAALRVRFGNWNRYMTYALQCDFSEGSQNIWGTKGAETKLSGFAFIRQQTGDSVWNWLISPENDRGVTGWQIPGGALVFDDEEY